MPIVILLDTSLSMNQKVLTTNNGSISRINLALDGLNSFLDYQAKNNWLDLISLIFFSGTPHMAVKFTRDFEVLKGALQNVQTFDKTNLVHALGMVRNLISEEFKGPNFFYHVLVVTDGNALLQSSFLNKGIGGTYHEHDATEFDSSNWSLPLPFKSKIHFLCITTLNDLAFQRSIPFYKEILSRNSSCKLADISVNSPCEGGQIWVPNVQILSYNVIENLFSKLSAEHFQPLRGKVICGNLSSPVSLYPNLVLDPTRNELFQSSLEISVYGFLSVDEIANPPVYSRHIVQPMTESLDEFKKWMSFINYKSDMTEQELLSAFAEESNQPSVAVLLHGSLKVANFVAFCQLNSSSSSKWYGILHSGADNKKKSCLMLSTFELGLDAIPWLATFENLGIAKTEVEANKVATVAKKPSNYVVWLNQSGMQCDVQKVLRYARKLPEKYEPLLFEVNRIKKTAIAFNFFELLEMLTKLLEREARLLPNTAHPDAVNYINQVIKLLVQP